VRKLGIKIATLAATALIITASLIPFINVSEASAITYNLITSRNIEMSDSNISDANVTYQVGFYPGSSYTIRGIVVDFCSNTPIINAACTAPTAMNITTTPTVATTGGVNTGLSTGWTVGYLANGGVNSILTLINSTGVAVTSGTQIIFTLSGVTNTSTANTTFYARILTYTATAGATSYSPAANGASTGATVQDAGGVALSTVSQLTITSKVQEQITFCIDTNSAANCGVASGTAVPLGDTNDVLSTSGPYIDKTAQYIVQTNASTGAAVRLKGNTLKSGAISLAATGTGTTSVPGTSQFGMCNYVLSGSNLSINATYNGGGGTNCSGTTQSAGTNNPVVGYANGATFAFNTTNTISTFGDQIATEAFGTQSTGDLVFIGNTSATQTAGIYTTVLTFIATGTF
jgi:hypothetical protein